MEINLKNNVVYNSFKTESEMKESIITFIMARKADKIIYKGDPFSINYKLLKKIIPLEGGVIYKPDDIRNTFKNIIDSMNGKFCVIYKK